MIIHAKDDDVVKYKPVEKFAKNLKCHFIAPKKGGHLSSSLLMNKKYSKRVETFLKK